MAGPVQQAIGSGSGTSFTITLGAAPLAGSALVLWGADDARNGTETVSGGGATWAQYGFRGVNGGLTCWVGIGCTGAAGLTVITYTMPSSGTVRHANVSEWADYGREPVAFAPDGSSATSTAPTMAVIAQWAGVAFAATDWIGAQTIGAASGGFTNLTQSSSAAEKAQAAYQEVAGRATYTAGWTLSGSVGWDTRGLFLIKSIVPPRNATLRQMPGKGGLRSVRNPVYPNGGSAPAAVTGTGGLAFGFSESATAAETMTGTGGIARPFSLAGTAKETMAATGGVAFGFSESATATERMTASGGVAFGFTESGTAKSTNTGTGAVAFGFSEAATAKETFASSGGLAFGFSLAATGRETFSGTGGVAFGFTESATATTGALGSGGVAFTFAESGTGAETVTGSGGDAFTFALSGSGTVIANVDGSGGVAFGFQVGGTATNTSVETGGRARAGFITFPKNARQQPVKPAHRSDPAFVTPEPVMSQPVLIAEGGVAFGWDASGEANVNDDDLLLALV